MRPHQYDRPAAALRDCARAGGALGLTGRRLLAYLELVCPYCPGEPGKRAWDRERRKRVGRLRRRKEAVREFGGTFEWG